MAHIIHLLYTSTVPAKHPSVGVANHFGGKLIEDGMKFFQTTCLLNRGCFDNAFFQSLVTDG